LEVKCIASVSAKFYEQERLKALCCVRSAFPPTACPFTPTLMSSIWTVL